MRQSEAGDTRTVGLLITVCNVCFVLCIGSLIAFNQAHRIIDFWTVIRITKINFLSLAKEILATRLQITQNSSNLTKDFKYFPFFLLKHLFFLPLL